MDVAKQRCIQQPWRYWDETALRRNIGVYVHVPFCLARCRYCGFLSYGTDKPDSPDPPDYITAMLAEIKRRGTWAREYCAKRNAMVDSVFIGGGTPTVLRAGALCEVVHAVSENFPLADCDVETTVEANPDTLDPAYVDRLAGTGVNRLSIGIQATRDRHLRFLGRTYRWSDVVPLLGYVADSPVPRLSFDLLYGIPHQTPAGLKQSVRRLLRFRPDHISAYELTCEPGTPYAVWVMRFPRQVASAERVVREQRMIERVLAGYGMYRYEVSNYALPGKECRHNLRYWRGGDYIGLGLGAASRTGTTVVNNPRKITEYKRCVQDAGTPADPIVKAAEPVMNSKAAELAPAADPFLQLRTRAGITLDGITVDPSWVRNGWIRVEGNRLVVTTRGLGFADLLARGI